MDCNPPGSSVHGVFQARILEMVAISSSRGSFLPRDQNCISLISCIGRQILYHWAIWDEAKMKPPGMNPDGLSLAKFGGKWLKIVFSIGWTRQISGKASSGKILEVSVWRTQIRAFKCLSLDCQVKYFQLSHHPHSTQPLINLSKHWLFS